jgi:hypothetical protein
MLTKKSLALLLLAASFAGCVSGPNLRSDFDQTANFAQYRTFGFVDSPGTDRGGYSTLVTAHFKTAVTREMEARGYVLSPNNPDLLVNFNATSRHQTDVRSTPSMGLGLGYYDYRYGLYSAWPLYASDVETVQYRIGTSNIDVVDAKRKQMVWEGVSEGRLTEEMLQNPGSAIDNTVTAMFSKYPARAGAAALPPAKK